MSFIGRLESFQPDMEKLIALLNERAGCAQYAFQPMKINVTDRVTVNRFTRLSLSQRAKDRIYNTLREDFEFFGYSR